MTEPVQMVEIPEEEYQRLLAAEERAVQLETLTDNLRTMVARAQNEAGVAVEERDRALTERNNLSASLSDVTQERDRLKNLLLGVVPSLEQFSTDYPQATIARTAFNGATPEEVGEQMASWDAARAQKASEWSSLVNHVRTQATV